MLPIEAVESAAPLAADIVGRGMTIMPVENSPLAALVKESIPSTAILTNTDAQYGISNSVYEITSIANASQPNTDLKPHDMVLDEIVPVIADAVRNHVAHARSVVVPYIEDMVKQVKDSFDAITPSSLLGVEVVVFNPPAPFVNSVFENSISKYSDTAYESGYSLPNALPPATQEQIDALLKTNSNDLDSDVSNWLNTLPAAFASIVWDEFFSGKITTNLHNYITSDKSGFGMSNANIDKLLVIHLLARNLFDNPPEGVAMNLAAYNEQMSILRNISGARLYIENQEYYTETGKRKTLVRSFVGNKVIVNGEVYKKWIEAGGENEVLFGNMLVSNPARDVDTITEKKEAFLAEWNRHCAVISAAEANRRFVRMKEIFATVFRKQVIAEEAADFNKEVAIKRFDEILETLREADFDNIYILSLKLVCRARFPDTDAESILTSINRVTKENPNIDIREAATVAVIEYIAVWIANQLKVV